MIDLRRTDWVAVALVASVLVGLPALAWLLKYLNVI